MSALAPPASSPPAAGWSAREAAFAALNFAVIALLVPPASLALFFAVCLAFVALCRVSPAALLPYVRAAGITVALGVLLYYKSSVFVFNDSVKGFAQSLFGTIPTWYAAGFLVPLGVSYCFLRFVYALLDPSVTLWQFVRYYFFFPTFFSGPIMAPGAFLTQKPSLGRDNLLRGVSRICYGLLKFALSALLQMAIPIATQHHAILALKTYPVAWLWATLFLAGVWLYLNFSAFTDIAIGVARLFGIRVPENFNNPFTAADLTDFWRRWHITLSEWLRANVFNPTSRLLTSGISPPSFWAGVVPVLFTMVVCGMWHQTTKPYLVWGVMHGVGLVAHQLWRRYVRPLLPASFVAGRSYEILSWSLTHLYISLTWVFFFPADVSDFGFHRDYLLRLFRWN